MAVGIGGDKWPAAELFCKLATSERWQSFFSSLIDGKRCIELGSGTGLIGILMCKAFRPNAMIITDLPSHVSHIQFNIESNNFESGRAIPIAEELDWCSSVSPIQKFDVIFAFEWLVHGSICFHCMRHLFVHHISPLCIP
jgi:methylase of polypeptide subunit release factors